MNLINLSSIFDFEWDKGNLEHLKKHNIEYNECEDVFYNSPVFFVDEKHSQDEERFLAYGITNDEKLLTLIFTIRNTKVRIISARNQNKKEKQIYQTYKQNK